MSDDVGVQPGRLNELASALEQLRDVLAANVPTIVSKLNMYWSTGQGTPISLSSLQHAQGRSVQDAAEIRARSNLAIAWEAKANARLPGDMISVPWPAPGKPLDAASAQADAQLLAQAEAESAKDPKAARAQIAKVEDDVQDHLDQGAAGTAWLQAFYDDAAPSVSRLALVLHDQDATGSKNLSNSFTVLSKTDQKILATFGDGLAAADKAGISAAAVKAIVDAPSPWSAAMLIKYGPSGADYATSEINPATGKRDAPSLLAQLTDKVYEDERTGKLQIPMGNTQPYDWSDSNKYQDAIADFEPLTPLLNADAQNRDAAWQVLGGPEGGGIAKQLLSEGPVPGAGNIVYILPEDPDRPTVLSVTGVPANGPFPSESHIFRNSVPSSVLAAFLNAATSAGRGGSPADKLSATAAANIILNTPPGSSDNNGNPQPSFPPDVERALTTTFLRYLPDIALSTSPPDATLPGGQPDVYQLTNPTTNQPITPYIFKLPQSDMANFLQQISSTPQNYGLLKGAVASAAGNALADQLNNVGQTGIDAYTNFTSLYGMLIQENTNLKYSGKQMLDAMNAQLNAQIAFAENYVKYIPVVGNAASEALNFDQQLAGLGFPQIPQFSTDNAANELKSAKQAMLEAESNAIIPIIQGLAQNNVPVYVDINGKQYTEDLAKLGAEKGWYKDGKVVNNLAFQNWASGQGLGMVHDKTEDGKVEDLNSKLMQWQYWMKQAAAQTNTTGS